MSHSNLISLPTKGKFRRRDKKLCIIFDNLYKLCWNTVGGDLILHLRYQRYSEAHWPMSAERQRLRASRRFESSGTLSYHTRPRNTARNSWIWQLDSFNPQSQTNLMDSSTRNGKQPTNDLCHAANQARTLIKQGLKNRLWWTFPKERALETSISQFHDNMVHGLCLIVNQRDLCRR